MIISVHDWSLSAWREYLAFRCITPESCSGCFWYFSSDIETELVTIESTIKTTRRGGSSRGYRRCMMPYTILSTIYISLANWDHLGLRNSSYNWPFWVSATLRILTIWVSANPSYIGPSGSPQPFEYWPYWVFATLRILTIWVSATLRILTIWVSATLRILTIWVSATLRILTIWVSATLRILMYVNTCLLCI